MSFSREVKQELAAVTEMPDCCMLAEVSGIIHTAGSLVKNKEGLGAEIITQTDMSAFLQAALTGMYGSGVGRNWEYNSLGGNHIFIIPPQIAKSVLTDCGIIRYDEEGNIEIIKGIDSYLIQEDCCKASYIRGIFLGGGSISGIDGSGFHLEFVMNSEALARDAVKLFEGIDIRVHTAERRGKYIIYIKGGEIISDALAYMGAGRAVIRLNELMVLRDVKNRINRGNNCFNANTDKMISAELTQVEAIQYISGKKGLAFLPEKLRVISEYRLNNANKSYEEMSGDLKISRSTVGNRLKKITEIADKLRREPDV